MGKKILYLTTRLPYPVIGGDKLRIYNILKQLKNNGYDITLVSLVTEDDPVEECVKNNDFFNKLIPVKFDKKLAYLSAVKAVFNDHPFIVEYYYSNSMQKAIDELLKKEHFDIISGYMIRIAPYLEKYRDKNIIIDFVDAVSMMYERRIKNVKSLWDKTKIGIEYLKVRNYEKKCAKIFKMQTVISETDKNYIENFSKKSNIHIIGNGVDTDYYRPQKFAKKNKICFVGSMQYIPNSEAALYFMEEVLPMVRQNVPDVEFIIIGANPRKELLDAAKNKDYVTVTGRVDDVREYMRDCKVSVCPVKIAGGIQNKVLEAMAMEIPVVTTPEGAEGIDETETFLHIAKTNDEYAQKVIDLLNNQQTNTEKTNNARNFVIENFSWKKVGTDLDKLIKEELDA